MLHLQPDDDIVSHIQDKFIYEGRSYVDGHALPKSQIAGLRGENHVRRMLGLPVRDNIDTTPDIELDRVIDIKTQVLQWYSYGYGWINKAKIGGLKTQKGRAIEYTLNVPDSQVERWRKKGHDKEDIGGELWFVVEYQDGKYGGKPMLYALLGMLNKKEMFEMLDDPDNEYVYKRDKGHVNEDNGQLCRGLEYCLQIDVRALKPITLETLQSK